MDQAAMIDGLLDGNARKVGRRAVFHRSIDDRGNVVRVRAQQEEIDQAVLQRGAAVLDRLGRVDRIDAMHDRRCHCPPGKPARYSHPNSPQQKSGDEAQAVRKEPMVGDGHKQKEKQRGGHQQDQTRTDIDQPDLPAGVLQAFRDEIVVAPWVRTPSSRGRVDIVPLAMMVLLRAFLCSYILLYLIPSASRVGHYVHTGPVPARISRSENDQKMKKLSYSLTFRC